jgi:glutamate synthase (NADPH/NADH)
MGRVSFAEDTKLPQETDIGEEQASVYAYQDGPENKSWAGASIHTCLRLCRGLTVCSHIKGKASHKIISDGKTKN